MKKGMKYLVGLALVLSILINFGCPGIFGYNIIGTWNVTATFGILDTEDYTMTFAGDKKSGSVTWTFVHPELTYTLTGTYTVSGKNIDCEVGDEYELQTFTGTFENKDEMSGDGNYLIYGDAGPAVLHNRMRRQARAAADSESWTFTWVAKR